MGPTTSGVCLDMVGVSVFEATPLNKRGEPVERGDLRRICSVVGDNHKHLRHFAEFDVVKSLNSIIKDGANAGEDDADIDEADAAESPVAAAAAEADGDGDAAMAEADGK